MSNLRYTTINFLFTCSENLLISFSSRRPVKRVLELPSLKLENREVYANVEKNAIFQKKEEEKAIS